MLGVEAIPATIYTFFALTIPKSPRWLIHRLKIDEAQNVLGITNPGEDVEELM